MRRRGHRLASCFRSLGHSQRRRTWLKTQDVGIETGGADGEPPASLYGDGSALHAFAATLVVLIELEWEVTSVKVDGLHRLKAGKIVQGNPCRLVVIGGRRADGFRPLQHQVFDERVNVALWVTGTTSLAEFTRSFYGVADCLLCVLRTNDRISQAVRITRTNTAEAITRKLTHVISIDWAAGVLHERPSRSSNSNLTSANESRRIFHSF